MKIAAFLLGFIYARVLATVQEFDRLILSEQQLNLRIAGRSILQYYYSQRKIEYPFQSTSTGNDRRHVATRVVSNSKLYLKSLSIGDKIYTPQHFNINSYTGSYDSAELIMADWFTGALDVDQNSAVKGPNEHITHFFQVRYSVIVNTCEVQIKLDIDSDSSCQDLRKIFDRYLDYDSYTGEFNSMVANGFWN